MALTTLPTAAFATGSVGTSQLADGAVTTEKLVADVNFRNLLINGDMSIAQRSTSTSSYSGISYSTVDRFKTVFEYGTYTVSQESLSSGAAYNAGFRTAFKALVTSTASPGAAGEQVTFEQRIEGLMCQALKKGTSNAESLTLSFWVKTNKTGIYTLELEDKDNTRSFSQTYTVSSADTWEKKTLTYAGDTTGAFDNDNGASLKCNFWLGAGSDFTSGTFQNSWGSKIAANRVSSSQVNLADNTANEFYITGVQLEAGTTASDFEFLPYDVNLQRCKRYFSYIPPSTHFSSAVMRNNTLSYGFGYFFEVEMRASPTITYADIIMYKGDVISSAATFSLNDINKFGFGNSAIAASSLSATDGDAVLIFVGGSGYVNMDAEL